eukprot:4148786-Ditylum_brightwellii.AAC.1
MLTVEKQNSSTTDGGTNTTAAQHTVTVNVHMHISPANQNIDPKSSANASRQINGKNENTEKSNSGSYKSSLPTQKGFSKCSCIFLPH